MRRLASSLGRRSTSARATNSAPGKRLRTSRCTNWAIRPQPIRPSLTAGTAQTPLSRCRRGSERREWHQGREKDRDPPQQFQRFLQHPLPTKIREPDLPQASKRFLLRVEQARCERASPAPCPPPTSFLFSRQKNKITAGSDTIGPPAPTTRRRVKERGPLISRCRGVRKDRDKRTCTGTAIFAAAVQSCTPPCTPQ